MCKGEGIYVYDNMGAKFIEGMSGLWCASLGFDNKELIEAAIKQMEKLPSTVLQEKFQRWLQTCLKSY